MRWSVCIHEYAKRDKNRLVHNADPAQQEELKKEIDAAFRDVADGPIERGQELSIDGFQRVIDLGRIRLIIDVNLRNVADPEDDRTCWILGVMNVTP